MGFKKIRELVLYNESGCELDRKACEDYWDIESILDTWGKFLMPGDRIEFVERESEE